MLTVSDVLRLHELRGARIVAGHKGLQAQVRWCHVSEVTDIARLLTGGEVLLTTGIALDLPPEQQTSYVISLRARGVAGLMLELERKFWAAPPAMVEAADRVGLPLITLPFDTPFVNVTQAVHKLILSQEAQREADGLSMAKQQLLADLANGQVADTFGLRQRLQALGYRLPESPWMTFVVADGQTLHEKLSSSMTTDLGAKNWLAASQGSEVHMLAFANDRSKLAAALRTLARRLSQVATGGGRVVSAPAGLPASLAEARQTMELRRINPGLSPLFAELGAYQLAMGRSREELQEYVDTWLGPLLQYDRAHRSNLCQTLRLLLDSRLAISDAAEQLHLTRQGLYHRIGRITQVLGRDLDEAEIRLALAMALRFQDVLIAAVSPER